MLSWRLKLLLIITLFMPILVFAQDGGDTSVEPGPGDSQIGDSQIAEEADEKVDGEGFTVSIDFRTGVDVIGIIPGIPAVVGVPMSISSDSVTIVPHFGFIYYFDVWSDLHNPYYIPLGISCLYNPLAVGGDVTYYTPVGGTNTTQMLYASVISELNILKKERFSLNFEVKFGPMFIFDPTGTRVQIMVETVFIPRYKL